MTRALGITALVVLAAACRGRDRHQALRDNTIANQDGTISQLKDRNRQLTERRAEAERRVAELEARLEKTETAEEVVEKATAELEEHVRVLIERFQGDKDVTVEPAPGGYRFVLREQVLFPVGSAELTADGKQALMRVADAVRHGGGHLSIEGHTDDRPVVKPETLKKFPRGNIELSVERSLSVWEYLVKEGKLLQSRLSVSGFGSSRPRAPNNSELGRYRNRRVEIRVAEN
ncbi:MAG: OmpA family protein [Planctomycetota bacterium]